MSDPGATANQFNLTDAERSPPCIHVNTRANVFFMLIYTLVFLVGLLFNCLILKIYLCGAQQQTSKTMTIYLKNLAAADILITLSLPIRITNYISSSNTIHRLNCTLSTSFFFLNMYASILFMGYIAANRYLKVVHPLRTHVLQTVQAAYAISIVTWIFLLVMGTTFIILSLNTEDPPLFISDVIICDSLTSEQITLFYEVFTPICVTIFLVVFISLVFFYHSTSCRLAVVQQRQLESPGSRKLARSRKNMLVLVTIFCVCFIPFHLIIIPYEFLWQQCSLSQVFYYLMELTIMLSTLNVCLDPLIYFIFCKAFRAQWWHRQPAGGMPDGMLGNSRLGDVTLDCATLGDATVCNAQ